MSVNSISGRVSTRMQAANMLNALRRNQLDLQRVQDQLSSGQKMQSSSEDPPAAGRIVDLAAILAGIDRHKNSAASAGGLLAAADVALGDAAGVLREAHSLALSAVDSTLDSSDRAAIAQQIGSLIEQLNRIANSKHLGRYLFDGQAGTGEPFVEFGAGMRYTGSGQPVRVALDQNWTQQTALDGVTTFGGRSGHVGSSVDMNPVLNTAYWLNDINGARGLGVTLGSICVSDGVNPDAVIDLSSALTIGDVIDIFNSSAPANMTMAIGSGRQRLSVTSTEPGSLVTIQDVDGGSCAADLGILGNGTAPVVAGRDVDARIVPALLLNRLNSGSGIDASGFILTNGERTATISLADTITVQDMINAVDAANIGAKAVISADGRSIQLLNTVSGTALNVAENGGLTASQFGWRTLHEGTPLSSLNGGVGVGMAAEGLPDFRITQRDGTTIDVTLAGCQTVEDVLAAVNSASDNTGDLEACISLDGGIQFNDYSVDAGIQFSVTALNSSSAAGDLGLVQGVAGAQITGTDTSGVWTEGPLDHLIRLRQAIAAGDGNATLRLGSLIESDLERLIGLRGKVANQAADVADQSDRLDGRRLDIEALLSQVKDADMTEAAVLFGQLQTQLTASMLTVGKMLDVSLLDFIR